MDAAKLPQAELFARAEQLLKERMPAAASHKPAEAKPRPMPVPPPAAGPAAGSSPLAMS